MQELKLVIWDLDETLVQGVFAENDRNLDPIARSLLSRLHERGTLQALATQNEPDMMDEAISHYGWADLFQLAEGDFSPKSRKVTRILETLEISPDHAVFVDADAFERDLVATQVPGLKAWSVPELAEHVGIQHRGVTDEARRRPSMYRALSQKKSDEERSTDLQNFLTQCDIRVTVRPYESRDEGRAIELLTRTNRMNLGTTGPPAVTVSGVAPGESVIVIAELDDRYGNSGRCGLMRLTPRDRGSASIDSIAISCRARARGLSLAMLLGMLDHQTARFDQYRCVFQDTGRNRPLRMLLWAAGFSTVPEGSELSVDRDTLDSIEAPAWVRIEHFAAASSADATPVSIGAGD